MAPTAVTDPAARRHLHFRLHDWCVFRVAGRDAIDLLSRLSTNDLGPLDAGLPVTTIFLSPAGRVMFRVLLAPRDGALVALAEPGSRDAFPAWLDRYTFAEDVRVELAGDLAATRALPIVEPGLQPLDGVTLARRDFGAEPSSLLIATPASLEALERGGALGEALDEVAAEQLRVEAGEPAAGAELTEDRFPLEAGLIGEISFTKGCYTGQEVVARQDTYGKVARRLVRASFPARPAAGDLVQSQGREAGAITSVAPLTTDGRHLALAFVPSKEAEPGATLLLATGLAGEVVGG